MSEIKFLLGNDGTKDILYNKPNYSNRFYIDSNGHTRYRCVNFHYKNRIIRDYREDFHCRNYNSWFKNIYNEDVFLEFEYNGYKIHTRGVGSIKIPSEQDDYYRLDYMINTSTNEIIVDTREIKSIIIEALESGYFFENDYTPRTINHLGRYLFGSIEAWDQKKREFFPSFACDSRLENPNKQSILQLYEYKKWELEFNYNGWTIAIIVNENAIPDFIASNNNFIESDDEKILIGSDASKLIKKALEEGYFQVNGFSDETINLITESLYGPRQKFYSQKK